MSYSSSIEFCSILASRFRNFASISSFTGLEHASISFFKVSSKCSRSLPAGIELGELFSDWYYPVRVLSSYLLKSTTFSWFGIVLFLKQPIYVHNVSS